MPARRIIRNPQGERCVQSPLTLYPTRLDLAAAAARHRRTGNPPPEKQKHLLEAHIALALSGTAISEYPPSDDDFEVVDTLFPALRELPDDDPHPPAQA